MNDNQPAIHPAVGKNDETVRAMCPARSLELLEALPALLRQDSLRDLECEAMESAVNYELVLQAINAFSVAPEDAKTNEWAATLVRREYIARKTLQTYQAEVALRQREAMAGMTH